MTKLDICICELRVQWIRYFGMGGGRLTSCLLSSIHIVFPNPHWFLFPKQLTRTSLSHGLHQPVSSPMVVFRTRHSMSVVTCRCGLRSDSMRCRLLAERRERSRIDTPISDVILNLWRHCPSMYIIFIYFLTGAIGCLVKQVLANSSLISGKYLLIISNNKNIQVNLF